MRNLFFFTLIFILALFKLQAQQPIQLVLEQRGEALVTLNVEDVLNIPDYASWSIEPISGDRVRVYLNKKQYQILSELNIPFIPESAPSLLNEVAMATSVVGMNNWDAYPDYDTYIAMMLQFATTYPEICLIDTIGETIEGRLLLALKISDNVASDEKEPEVFYTSSMHGDELTGYVLMLRFADYLLKNYQMSSVKYLVDNLEIFINPLANPDGTFASGNSTVNGATRSNANYVDLNRNFPDPQDGEHPDGEEWQPETMAMMNFMKKHHFVISMNFHGGVEVLNYPWDTFSRRHADDNWFIWVSREYADTVHTFSESYMNDFDDGITNGYDWYEVAGGRQDYVTYFLRGREITNEISTVKLVNESLLPKYWDYNYSSLLNYIKQATYGIHGFVTDTSGKALAAKISITNHDKDSSHVRTNDDGTFYRYLMADDYILSIESIGYITQNVSVRVDEYQKTDLHIIMQNPVEIAEIQAENWNFFPNPGSDFLTFSYQQSESEFSNCQLVIMNQLGKVVLSKMVDLENTQNTFAVDISQLTSGIYFIGFNKERKSGYKKLVIP